MPGRASHSDKQINAQHLSSAIPKIFDQVQISIANHQKNCVALHKLHSDAARIRQPINNGRSYKLTGEREFDDLVHLMLINVLSLKKGTTTADRVVKFIGAYTKFANEKAAEDKAENPSDNDDDSTASRFTARLLRFLLKGMEAKDKHVRYRVLQTLVEMVSHLGEVDEDIFTSLRDAILRRVQDKEATVRSQAVVALSKLCATETDDDLGGDEVAVIDVLLDSLAHDPSADVRRAVLLNLTINEHTIPHLLKRMRDVDPLIRKCVFSAVLEPNTTQGEDCQVMGPTHPRTLTISQREQIIKDGLGDRENTVRTVASSLIGKWIECVNVPSAEADDSDVKQEDLGVEAGILSLLRLFDLGQDTVAADALLSVFTARSDIFGKIDLNKSYWESLTLERAFLARVFVDHCVATKDNNRLEDALPTVSKLAGTIETSWNKLTNLYQNFYDDRLIRDFDEVELQEKEDEFCEKEAEIAEMLKMAVNLDYGDEIGRRTMYQLIREMTAKESLPESLIGLCLDVMRKLVANEKDLIRIVVEIISDLRDPFIDEPEEPPVDPNASLTDTPIATPKARPPPREKTEAEKKRAAQIDSRCLVLSIEMLERVNSTFEENSTLEGLMRDLIVPSIHIKDAHIREKAFVSLGLCCSIARKRALSSVDFFRSQILGSPDKMKPSLYKIIFDMLMVHDHAFAKIVPEKVTEITDKFLMDRLKEEQDPQVLAVLCLGIAKLILSGVARDVNSVANLMLAYLSPATSGNQELRQALTSFFPVYSYSSAVNQKTIMDIFLPVFSEIKKTRADLEEEEEMTTASQVANMFVDLTDPNRLASAGSATGYMNEKETFDNGAIQLKLATEVLKEFLKPEFDFDKDDKRVLCQMFSRFYIPDAVDDALIRRLKLYLDIVKTHRPFKDATSRNALFKFDTVISKRFEKQLEFSEEELRQLEEFQDIFEILDDLVPDNDDELLDPEPKRRGKKRRSTSVATTASESETISAESGRGQPKPKKRRRISGEDDGSDEDMDEGTPRPAVKTRVMPKRAATGNMAIQPIVLTDSEDEGHVDTPKNKKSTSKTKSRQVKREDSLESLTPTPSSPSTIHSPEDDSILGPEHSEEEEEEEVNDLLVED